jgi:hypothetical protein
MKTSINKGDKVTWKWGDMRASGQVIDTYIHKSIKEIKDSDTIRHISDTAIALLIELEDGRKVLKLEDEVKLERA